MAAKRVVITGATSGIGREAARQMSAQGASLILTARDVAKGEAVAAEIARATGRDPPAVVACDTSRPASIRACAAAIRAKAPHLDVLVNNAGIQSMTRTETPEGIEKVFATNVLGYHLLTRELLPLLKAAERARIVTVASTYAGELDFDDLEFSRRPWDNIKSYKQTKQANRLWTWALARRLQGTKVTANAMSPGFVDTGLYRDMKPANRMFMRVLTMLFGRSVAKGADTVTWLALSPDVEGRTNLFWVDRKETACQFRSEKDEERMWSICEEYASRNEASPSAADRLRSPNEGATATPK
jgi:NAD(P)-dependent dehydrogenase (short-subunit alcohol dehydrogenase family)